MNSHKFDPNFRGWWNGVFVRSCSISIFQSGKMVPAFIWLPPILINSLHPNNAIQLTLYIKQYIHFDQIKTSLFLYITLYTYTINTVFNTTTLSSSFLQGCSRPPCQSWTSLYSCLLHFVSFLLFMPYLIVIIGPTITL